MLTSQSRIKTFFKDTPKDQLSDNQGSCTLGGSPVKITSSDLISLKTPAASLRLDPGRNHALQSGDYLSPLKGRGMEFDESRPYQPGDDIRNLDWRVTARTGKTHTKTFCEERERPVFLWVDYRAPMFFATRGRYKSVLAAHLAGLLGWCASLRGDRIGGLVFSDDVHHELKPRRGRDAVLRLIDALAHHPCWEQPALTTDSPSAARLAMARLRLLARPGSLIFLISDFRGLDADAESYLVRVSQHNDCILLPVTDILERELPPPGRYGVTDGVMQFVVDSGDRKVVGDYRHRFEERQRRLNKLARKYGMSVLPCDTSDDPLTVLQKGFGRRK